MLQQTRDPECHCLFDPLCKCCKMVNYTSNLYLQYHWFNLIGIVNAEVKMISSSGV